jgi:hypothetical protein
MTKKKTLGKDAVKVANIVEQSGGTASYGFIMAQTQMTGSQVISAAKELYSNASFYPSGGYGGSVSMYPPYTLPEQGVYLFGGTTFNAPQVTITAVPTAAAPSPEFKATDDEKELYEMMETPLKKQLAEHLNLSSDALVIRTAYLGSAETGGKWSRPDFLIVAVMEYPFVPGKHLEVLSFEVKKHDAIDITAVYEAAAHLRRATSSYVVLHAPRYALELPTTEKDEKNDMRRKVAAISIECIKQEVGLIVMHDPKDMLKWTLLIPAIHRDTHPAQLNEGIAQLVLDEKSKKQIQKLIGRVKGT